jgi:hypothetical protein
MPLYRRREALNGGAVCVLALVCAAALAFSSSGESWAQLPPVNDGVIQNQPTTADQTQRGKTSSQVKKIRARDLTVTNTSPFGPGTAPALGPITGASASAAPASQGRSIRKPVTLSRGGGASGGGGTLNMQSLIRFNTLLLDPTDETFEAGEEFVTTLVLSNPKKEPVDRIRAALQYNASFVKPLGVAGIPAEAFLAAPGDMKALDHPERAILSIDAKLTALPALIWVEIVQIKWVALAPTLETAIDFINTEAFPTQALSGDSPALGNSALEISGLIGGAYQIVPSEFEESESAEQLTDNTDPNSYIWAMGQPNKGKAVSLKLRAPSAPLKAGDKFFVDVLLDNPMGARFDGLNIVIDFDPALLRVDDCDQGNWIEIGTNIFDGAYHADFPFDVHYRNQAFNDLGQIHYMVATSKLGHPFPTGKMASILFTALAPASKAEIRFHQATDPIDNGVMATFLGQTVLAEGGDGLKGAFVKILP